MLRSQHIRLSLPVVCEMLSAPLGCRIHRPPENKTYFNSGDFCFKQVALYYSLNHSSSTWGAGPYVTLGVYT